MYITNRQILVGLLLAALFLPGASLCYLAVLGYSVEESQGLGALVLFIVGFFLIITGGAEALAAEPKRPE